MPHDGDQQGTVNIMSGLYGAFRRVPFNPYYGPLKTPVTVDVLEVGLLVAVAVLVICCLLALPGITGWKDKLFVAIRGFLSIFIGAVILLTNFGQEWEFSSIHTKTAYKAGTGEEINANIEMKIGLRSVNITLHGTPEQQLGETINYNERFHWAWTQGRFGFGPQSGTINQEYRAAQQKGLPLPILWIAEYFTFDGEGIRFGRFYRWGGWYAHIALWTAFPCWILTNVLFFMVIRYAAYMMMTTGFLMLLANIVFSALHNPNPLVIPFEDGRLEPTYGWCWYLCLITGLITLILGAIVFVVDMCFPYAITSFFGLDPFQDFEQTYIDPTTLNLRRGVGKTFKMSQKPDPERGAPQKPPKPPSSVQMQGAGASNADDDNSSEGELYENAPNKGKPPVPSRRKDSNKSSDSDDDEHDYDNNLTLANTVSILRKRGISRFQKKTFKQRQPAALPRAREEVPEERSESDDDEEDWYANVPGNRPVEPGHVSFQMQNM